MRGSHDGVSCKCSFPALAHAKRKREGRLNERPCTGASPACRLVRVGQPFIGKQNLEYSVGISAESVGAEGIHMQLVTIPPGGRAKAHKHATHETAIYALQGESGVWHGERLEYHTVVRPGDFF